MAVFAFQSEPGRQTFAKQLLQANLIGRGIFVAQAIEHDPAGSLKQSRAGQKPILGRHAASRPNLVEKQLVNKLLRGFHSYQ